MRIGIPHAKTIIEDGKAFALCPTCDKRIRLRERKDDESWSGIEYARHHAVHHEAEMPEGAARELAYVELGRKLTAAIEVLHMADRAAAIEVMRLLLPTPDMLAEVLDDMGVVGAGALADDVREVERQQAKKRKRAKG